MELLQAAPGVPAITGPLRRQSLGLQILNHSHRKFYHNRESLICPQCPSSESKGGEPHGTDGEDPGEQCSSMKGRG